VESDEVSESEYAWLVSTWLSASPLPWQSVLLILLLLPSGWLLEWVLVSDRRLGIGICRRACAS
jgi:hypothetical protein